MAERVKTRDKRLLKRIALFRVACVLEHNGANPVEALGWFVRAARLNHSGAIDVLICKSSYSVKGKTTWDMLRGASSYLTDRRAMFQLTDPDFRYTCDFDKQAGYRVLG